MGTSQTRHRWQFFRAGGFDQVRLDRGEDLVALHELDQKLWVALSCPTRGLEFDARTLDLLDTDTDGRIRAPELLAATRWACRMLKDPAVLLSGSSSLALDNINADDPEGATLLASARQILANRGKVGAEAISMEDVGDLVHIFAGTRFNGDGVVTPASAGDEAEAALIRDIMDCMGTDLDRSGEAGVSQERVDRFFAEAEAHAAWLDQAGRDAAAILPLGESTTAAFAAFQAVKAKVDDYFARCRLAAYDERAVAALNRDAAEYLALARADLSASGQEAAGFPLAMVGGGRPLPLERGINPAWAGALRSFRDVVVTPLLGDRDALAEADWARTTAAFAGHEAWLARKAGGMVEKLGPARVRAILAGGRDGVNGRIGQDKALESEASAIDRVEKLVRFNRDLCSLLT